MDDSHYDVQKIQIRNNIPLEEAKSKYKRITKKNAKKVRETKNFYQFRLQPPTRFIKGSFRSKKVNKDVILIVAELKPEFQHLSGGGFGDYFKRAYSAVSGAVSSVGNKIVNAFTIHDYSTKTKRNLELYGDLPVVALEIRRKPLNIAIELAFQGVSAGQWAELKKKYGFDKFYHLSAVVTLKKEDTKQMAFEKLEVVSFNDNIGYKEGDGTEILPVEVTKPFTVAGMFEKTRKTVGDDRFFSYSGVGGNNCQDFIAMCLTSVGLYGPEEKSFTYQDMKALTDELPLKVKAVARGVTQIGAIANKFLGIGGNQFFDEEYENEIPHSLNSIIGGMRGGMRDRKTELLIGDYVDFLGRRGLTPQESRDIANMYVRQLLDTNDRKKLRVIRKHIQNDMDSQRESGLDPIPEKEGYGNPKHDEDLRANKKNKKGGVLPLRNEGRAPITESPAPNRVAFQPVEPVPEPAPVRRRPSVAPEPEPAPVRRRPQVAPEPEPEPVRRRRPQVAPEPEPAPVRRRPQVAPEPEPAPVRRRPQVAPSSSSSSSVPIPEKTKKEKLKDIMATVPRNLVNMITQMTENPHKEVFNDEDLIDEIKSKTQEIYADNNDIPTDILRKAIDELRTDDRVKVYIEGYSTYSTHSAIDPLLELIDEAYKTYKTVQEDNDRKPTFKIRTSSDESREYLYELFRELSSEEKSKLEEKMDRPRPEKPDGDDDEEYRVWEDETDEWDEELYNTWADDREGRVGEIIINATTKKGRDDAIHFLRNLKELIDNNGNIPRDERQDELDEIGDGKSQTQQFYEYVMAHKHDLKAKHTLEQMFIDWKELKKGAGNQASGFIRAIMARNDDPKNAKMNKSKFRNLDKQGMNVDKMSKASKDVIKKKVKDPKYKEYLLNNALQHQPLSEGKTNYRGTYDMGQHYVKHKKEEGKDITESRKKKREEPYEEPFFPEDMFVLPKPKRKRPNVAVVPVEDIKKEEKEESKKPEEKQEVIVGKFKSPKDEFEEEINKLVDFGVSHLHFNDLISELANPSTYNYRDQHSGVTDTSELCLMYYYITKYKIPMIHLGYTRDFRITKDISIRKKNIKATSYKELREKEEQIYGDNEKKSYKSYNTLESIPTKDDTKTRILPEIKKVLEHGEKLILIFLGIGTKSAGLHSNLILIRAVEKEIHIIDPHGTRSLSKFKAQYKKVETFGNDVAKGLGFKYVSSEESCPYLKGSRRKGFQAIENLAGYSSGFCGWWNSFIIEMCCLKPDTPFVDIYKESAQLLTDEPEKLYRAIVQYQWKLQQTILEIANKAGIETEHRADMENVYERVAIVASKRLEELGEKRMNILGYGEKIILQR